MTRAAAVERLIHQGVIIPDPERVWIDPKVDIDRIAAPGAVFFPDCRILGARTFIAAEARIGAEGPVTVQDSFIGPGAEVRGGYCNGAVLLAGASLGTESHVRPATILEEQASTAHAVGLKHTVLFPFVTLGSLINFCDILMAGGTGRQNHSEVGSSYIHFNFTPFQDKATASLLGDVPSGVMLDRPPIFLGGQGGLVGPCRLAFGTVVAAGTIIRKDELRCGRLIAGGAARSLNIDYRPGTVRGIPRIVTNNLVYIGNLIALRCWYRQVRQQFVGSGFPAPLYQGLVETLETLIEERIHRMARLQERMVEALDLDTDALSAQARLFVAGWPAMADTLIFLKSTSFQMVAEEETAVRGLDETRRACGNDYIATMRALGPEIRRQSSAWLQRVVDTTVKRSMEPIPGFSG